MSDKIKIRNLEVFAHHGVYQEETKLGQKFLVDACLHLDLRRAGFSDEIQNSVDYGAVCRFITKYMKEHTFKLLEAVAGNSADCPGGCGDQKALGAHRTSGGGCVRIRQPEVAYGLSGCGIQSGRPGRLCEVCAQPSGCCSLY